jgi:exopolysaccharide biosynthesis WecB/TagA/CpsF family protein
MALDLAERPDAHPALDILGVRVAALGREDAVAVLDRRFAAGRATMVAFLNAHASNLAARDAAFRAALSDALVLNDGVGVDIACRTLHGRSFPANLNGTDFVPYYLRATEHRFRLALVGGKRRVVECAAARLVEFAPQHRVVFDHHGFFAPEDEDEVAAAVREAQADVLLVAQGNPRQEMFLARQLATTGVRLGFGVGALFDFVAGEAARAPLLLRRARLEWAFRLAREPRRLAGRYLLGNPRFLARIAVQRLERDRLARRLPPFAQAGPGASGRPDSARPDGAGS